MLSEYHCISCFARLHVIYSLHVLPCTLTGTNAQVCLVSNLKMLLLYLIIYFFLCSFRNLRELSSEKGEVTFSRICPPRSTDRATAARMFSALLGSSFFSCTYYKYESQVAYSKFALYTCPDMLRQIIYLLTIHTMYTMIPW